MSNSLLLVYEAIDQVNQQIDEGPKIIKELSTPLLDNESGVDSLLLVNLLVELEQKIFDRTGKTITIVDESVYSSPESPFKTIGSLANFIEKLLG